MIEPGDKVVCIDDEWSNQIRGFQRINGIPCPLVRGAVYTVIGLETWPITPATKLYGQKTLVLKEVKNVTHSNLVGFAASRFRKLPTISQGLEQLKAIVHNPRQGVKV